jgi:hypothetical protein
MEMIHFINSKSIWSIPKIESAWKFVYSNISVTAGLIAAIFDSSVCSLIPKFEYGL